MKYDVVIIGGGHNGLVCACYLARAGLSVRVLERRGVVGGAAVTEEFHPGFRNSTLAYTVSLLDPRVIRDLRLAEHGLRIVERPFANFLPLPDGGSLRVGPDTAATQAELARFSTRDAERLPAYYRMLERIADVLRDLAQADAAAPCRRTRRTGRPARRLAPRAQVAPARSRRTARPARAFHPQRGRPARRVVRERRNQGRARLRCRGRQFRQPLRGGLGLRAAAPLLRRSQRQARQVGACDRRHGRDHAGDGAGSRGARRRNHDQRRSRARTREGRTNHGCRARGRNRDRGPHHRLERRAEPALPAPRRARGAG